MRALIVGAGLMGRWHAHALKKAGGSVVGVIDVDGDRARQLASASSAVAHTTLTDALDTTPVDVVHVCTPPASHEALISEALEAECHVIAEKPLTDDPASTERLLDQATATGLTLTPVHQFPFQRGVRRLLDSQNDLGAIRSLAGNVCSAGADHLPDSERDRIAGEIVPHFRALTAAFVTTPIDDPAAKWACSRSAPGEWQVSGRISDVSVSIAISMSTRPTRNEWEVRGTEATGRADLFHGFSVIDRGGASRTNKILRPVTLPIRYG